MELYILHIIFDTCKNIAKSFFDIWTWYLIPKTFLTFQNVTKNENCLRKDEKSQSFYFHLIFNKPRMLWIVKCFIFETFCNSWNRLTFKRTLNPTFAPYIIHMQIFKCIIQSFYDSKWLQSVIYRISWLYIFWKWLVYAKILSSWNKKILNTLFYRFALCMYTIK